jgi:hypothetical protein
MADGCCHRAGAISPDSPIVRPPRSVGSCQIRRRDTATTGGWCRRCRAASITAPFSANGVFGQTIFVNPAEQVVIAIQSAWRQPRDRAAEVENVAMIRAAVRALRTAPAS